MPIIATKDGKSIAISFNGNIVNVRKLQDMVGVDRSRSDAHALCHLILQKTGETKSIEEAAKSCMEVIDGSFSITGLDGEGSLFAFRDKYGIKPLCYGCKGKTIAFSSESVGLDINEITLEGEIHAGEIMKIVEGKIHRERVSPCRKKAFCAFEFAYFARPDSRLNGTYVYKARQKFGVNLVESSPELVSKCDLVVSLPETANDAAYGFHEASGLPWEMATRRHRYVTQRAFITSGEQRGNIINRKMNFLDSRFYGKSLAVIDDSIVRGDTSRSVIKRLRAGGAKKINMFITFPKISGPCFYGIDMASFTELIGAWKDSEEIAKAIGADSVNYQSIDDYLSATGMTRDELCFGCVTGEYPTPMAENLAKQMKERLIYGEQEKGRIYENN